MVLPELLHSAELSVTKETLEGVRWHSYATQRWNSVSWSQHLENPSKLASGRRDLVPHDWDVLSSHITPLTNVALAKSKDVFMVEEKGGEEETLKAGLGLGSTVFASHAWGPRFNPHSNQKEKDEEKRRRKLRRGERSKQKQWGPSGGSSGPSPLSSFISVFSWPSRIPSLYSRSKYNLILILYT